MSERFFWAVLWMVILFTMVAFGGFLVYLLISPANSHDAPSGWRYPAECCSADGTSPLCHPVACEEISQDSVGNYVWSGLHFTHQQVFPTQDDTCHACNSTDGGKPAHPYCLFIRQSAWQKSFVRWANERLHR